LLGITIFVFCVVCTSCCCELANRGTVNSAQRLPSDSPGAATDAVKDT